MEQRKINLGHLKRWKTKKDTLDRKEGNLCPIGVVRKSKAVPLTIPQLFYSWYSSHPP